jgi:drug/metabolite transporter (DMT)-like permease
LQTVQHAPEFYVVRGEYTAVNDHERQAVHGSVLSLAGGALAFLASYVHPPNIDVAAVFGIAAVVLLAVYYLFDRPRSIAGAWVAPTVAGVVVLASGSAPDLRFAGLSLAGISVVGFVSYPLTAYAAKLGERVAGRLRSG